MCARMNLPQLSRSLTSLYLSATSTRSFSVNAQVLGNEKSNSRLQIMKRSAWWRRPWGSSKSSGMGKPYMKFTLQVRTLCEQSITSISDLDLAFPTPVVRAVAKYLDLGYIVSFVTWYRCLWNSTLKECQNTRVMNIDTGIGNLTLTSYSGWRSAPRFQPHRI